MKIYIYSDNGIYIGKSVADENPLEKGNFLIPTNATIKEPLPTKDNFAICFNEQKDEWEYVEDNRNKIVYSTADKSETKIDYLGAIKDGFTLNQPKEFDKWNGTTWEADIQAIKASELQLEKEKRELLLNSIIVEISTGKKFDGREKDRNNMLSAIQSAQFLNENQTIWKLADNTKQTITLDELKEALSLSIKRAGEIILGDLN